MSKKEEREYEEYESLKNSKFKQQKLTGWRPVPSMPRTVTIFISVGIFFAGLGVLILFFSNEMDEYIQQYNNVCDIGEKCNVTISINKKMKANISVYYKLDRFYQNHRRYISSKSEEQLTGKDYTEEQIKKDCFPYITNKEMGVNKSIDGSELNKDDIAIPCGLMAKNYFNDNFINWFYKKPNSEEQLNIIVNDKNIARKSDREKYKNSKNIARQWIDLEKNEHFMVWMRPAPLTNFTKLWGRIEMDLEKGSELTVTIENNYDVSHFQGAKYIVLRTNNIFGGENRLLAIEFMVFRGICIILGVIFIFAYKAHEKKEK